MKKGFTLIELLITMLIIGIIVSLAVVGLNSVRSKSRDARRISDVRQLQNALEIYRNDNGVYPSAITSGEPLIGENDYTYMSAVPTAPGTNDGSCASDVYVYDSTDPNTTYSLTYCLGGVVQSVGPGNLTAIPGDIGVAEPPPQAYTSTKSPGTVNGYPSGYDNIKVSDASYFVQSGSSDLFYGYLINGSTFGDMQLDESTFTAVEVYVPFGGSTNTWGATLTPGIINGSNFGVDFMNLADLSFTATNFGFEIPLTATIDGVLMEMQGKTDGASTSVNHVRVTVYYTD